MSSQNKTVIAFDLYGTLLSTESIAKELASHFGEDKAQAIAGLWRRYQLEYTWRLNSMLMYKPFNEITLTSLNHALAESKESLSQNDIDSLMKAYDSLSTFPEVDGALKSLAKDESIDAYVFSNGTDSMVGNSVKQSPELGPHASVFKDLVTIEEPKAFKPHPKVYQHLATKVGKSHDKKDMATIWLVSGNPFDIVGARQAGLQAAWVDRPGGHHGQGGWTDQLGTLASGGPTVIATGVDDAVEKIRKWTEDKKSSETSSGAGHNLSAAAMGPG